MIIAMMIMMTKMHCVKSVRIQSFSRPHSLQMRENTDQKNSEYGQAVMMGLKLVL